jgi:hypothetical protein
MVFAPVLFCLGDSHILGEAAPIELCLKIKGELFKMADIWIGRLLNAMRAV